MRNSLGGGWWKLRDDDPALASLTAAPCILWEKPVGTQPPRDHSDLGLPGDWGGWSPWRRDGTRLLDDARDAPSWPDEHRGNVGPRRQTLRAAGVNPASSTTRPRSAWARRAVVAGLS